MSTTNFDKSSIISLLYSHTSLIIILDLDPFQHLLLLVPALGCPIKVLPDPRLDPVASLDPRRVIGIILDPKTLQYRTIECLQRQVVRRSQEVQQT